MATPTQPKMTKQKLLKEFRKSALVVLMEKYPNYSNKKLGDLLGVSDSSIGLYKKEFDKEQYTPFFDLSDQKISKSEHQQLKLAQKLLNQKEVEEQAEADMDEQFAAAQAAEEQQEQASAEPVASKEDRIKTILDNLEFGPQVA